MHCCGKPNLSESRTVLIIGGGNGIGYELTTTLLNETNDIVISCDIDIKSSLEKLKNEEKYKDDDRFNISHCDVTDIKSIESCIDKIKNEFKINMFDRICICCGIFNGQPLMEIEDKDFINTFNVNVIGIWRIIKSIYKSNMMKYNGDNKDDNSRIIIISSEMASCHVAPFGEPYGITKSCLQDIARTLKIEFSTIGIDVITINPGAVDTQLLKHTEEKFARYIDDKSPFKAPCDLSLKCKDFVLKYSSCSQCKYIVDNTLIPAIHCNYKYIKYEYYIGQTWFNYLQPFIPNFIYDNLMMNMFYYWINGCNCCSKSKKKKVQDAKKAQ